MTERAVRWVVTGGCGFIGSSLVRTLMDQGPARIRILDDLSRGSLDALPEGAWRQGPSAPDDWSEPLAVMVAAVEDASAVARCVTGADVVVHLAANAGVVQSIQDPMRDLEVNVVGTVNVLDQARLAGVPRVVVASSAAAVGVATPPISERSLPRPSTPYGAGKLAAEAYAGAFAETFGLESVCLRFGNVYGPFSTAKDSVVARWIKQWMAGETLEVFGDGDQTRDFIYLHDLLNAVVLAATEPGIGGRVFQIATGAETSVNELLTELRCVIESAGAEPPSVRHSAPRAGDVRRNYSDTRLARELLGWEASTTLRNGLQETVRWFLEAG